MSWKAEAGSGDESTAAEAFLWEEVNECACNPGAKRHVKSLARAGGHANMGCVGSKAVKGVDRKLSNPFTSSRKPSGSLLSSPLYKSKTSWQKAHPASH